MDVNHAIVGLRDLLEVMVSTADKRGTERIMNC